jgi:hypothetical protein
VIVPDARKTYQIRNETSTAYALDSVLGGLCLLLAVDDGNIGNLDVDKVVLADPVAELCEGLNERHVLDIADCAALSRKLEAGVRWDRKLG